MSQPSGSFEQIFETAFWAITPVTSPSRQDPAIRPHNAPCFFPHRARQPELKSESQKSQNIFAPPYQSLTASASLPSPHPIPPRLLFCNWISVCAAGYPLGRADPTVFLLASKRCV